MKNMLLFVLLSGLLSSAAISSNLAPPCHRLMTKKECIVHRALLATMQPGVALDRYLSDYASTKKEREIACRR